MYPLVLKIPIDILLLNKRRSVGNKKAAENVRNHEQRFTLCPSLL